MEPAVLTNVADDNYAAIEESFGPILVISSFKDGYATVLHGSTSWLACLIIYFMYRVLTTVISPDSDVEGVLKRANNTEYGLASGVFTKDINKVINEARISL